MKISNILLTIGISLVVALGALTAITSDAVPQTHQTPIQKELSIQIAEN